MTSTCLRQNLTIQQGQATNSPTYFLFPIESPGLLNWTNSLCNQHTTAYKHLSMPSWINSLGKAMNTKCICSGFVFPPVETYFNSTVNLSKLQPLVGSKEVEVQGKCSFLVKSDSSGVAPDFKGKSVYYYLYHEGGVGIWYLATGIRIYYPITAFFESKMGSPWVPKMDSFST